jgi:hypothetical protein
MSHESKPMPAPYALVWLYLALLYFLATQAPRLFDYDVTSVDPARPVPTRESRCP